MAKKNVSRETKQEEALENGGGEENRSDNTGATGAGEKGTGEQGAGAPSGESQGTSGGEQGEQGGEQGGGGASNGGGENGNGGERASAKDNLLQRIRSKRANGLGDASSNPDGTSVGNSKANERGILNGNGGAKGDNGSSSRANRNNGRGNAKDGKSNGGSSDDSLRNGGTRLEEKPTGVNVKGVDKIKALAQQAAQVEAPKLKFAWDEKPLSNKEGEEVLPKIRALLEFVFRHMDKGISVSNRNKAEARIWSSIDDEDIDIIASHLVEMGKASKIVATAVRRMTNSYRLLQIGLITLPKFIQTYQFYAANGGFALALGGK